jgi:hypothetical protein
VNIVIQENVTTARNTDRALLVGLLKYTASTLRQSTINIQPGNSTLESWGARIVISSDIPSMKDDDIDLESKSEAEWHTIVSTPHVRDALRRLAAEARRQASAGETEEGGFAVE